MRRERRARRGGHRRPRPVRRRTGDRSHGRRPRAAPLPRRGRRLPGARPADLRAHAGRRAPGEFQGLRQGVHAPARRADLRLRGRRRPRSRPTRGRTLRTAGRGEGGRPGRGQGRADRLDTLGTGGGAGRVLRGAPVRRRRRPHPDRALRAGGGGLLHRLLRRPAGAAARDIQGLQADRRRRLRAQHRRHGRPQPGGDRLGRRSRPDHERGDGSAPWPAWRRTARRSRASSTPA